MGSIYRRYQVMAYVVGVMLIFVFLFGYVGHASLIGYHNSRQVENVIGPVHGALYIVYLFTVLQLWLKYRLRLTMVVVMVAAGWLPFTAFIGERWAARQLADHPDRYTAPATFESELEP